MSRLKLGDGARNLVTNNYTGANPVVGQNTKLVATGTANWVAPYTGLVTATVSASATVTGTQGAGAWAQLTDTTDFASGSGVPSGPIPYVSWQVAQVVATSTTFAIAPSKATFFVYAGITYRLDYVMRVGSGTPSVTFSALAMTLSMA